MLHRRELLSRLRREMRRAARATSRHVVKIDHRQPLSSRDLSEQLPGILASFEGIHLAIETALK